jgi:hypothetical protein
METVASHLTEELFAQALDVIATLPDEWSRSKLFIAVVERLPTALLGRALAVAMAFSYEGYQRPPCEEVPDTDGTPPCTA